jgi:chlorobactene glucosyltransferase
MTLIVQLLVGLVLFTLAMWLYCMFFLLYSFRHSPRLDGHHIFSEKAKQAKDNRDYKIPKPIPTVSIIIPCRNEEKDVQKCIDSLLGQDYCGLMEIIAVNDCSTDKTSEIIHSYSSSPSVLLGKPLADSLSSAHKESRPIFKPIDIKAKPEGWTGKNWACYQGYLNSSGEILLFIDADTTMASPIVLSLAVGQMLQEDLDAITARPHLTYEDNLWLKITMPIVWFTSHVIYSASSVNNPRKRNNGFVFGSFYLVTRKAYEMIGTHEAVKNEIAEDAAIGELIKRTKAGGKKETEKGIKSEKPNVGKEAVSSSSNGFLNMKMVLGEEYVQSVLIKSGGLKALWNLTQRTVTPAYQKDRIKALVIAFSMVVFLASPLVVLFFSVYLTLAQFPILPSHQLLKFSFAAVSALIGNWMMMNINKFADAILFLSSLALATTMVLASSTVLRKSLFQNPFYALASPLGAFIVSVAIISAVSNAINHRAIYWKDRKHG